MNDRGYDWRIVYQLPLALLLLVIALPGVVLLCWLDGRSVK